MARPRLRKPTRAGEIVAEVLRGAGALEAVREHRLVTGWSEIVGERVAARAWPDGLRHGVLYVRVANASWMQACTLSQPAFVSKSNPPGQPATG